MLRAGSSFLQRTTSSRNSLFHISKRTAGGFNSKFNFEKPYDQRNEVDPMYEYDPNFKYDSTVRYF